MKIWIDLANSPQVLFFRPLIAEFHRRGHETVITTRDYAQTIALADQLKLSHTSIGGHAGEGGLVTSILINIRRAYALLKYLKGQEIDLAVSHNAYAQAIASTLRPYPFVTAMDYEHQRGNHLPFRVAKLVITPESFPNNLLAHYGAKAVFKYKGVKEQLYLADFVPDNTYRQQIGLSNDKIVVTIRPPATWALYHKGIENHLTTDLLRQIGTHSDVIVVFLPRLDSQRNAIQSLGLPNIWVPDVTLNGPNLIYASDLVISAGGTMNREAAVLGVPVYSTFAGTLGSVDRYLIDQQRLTIVEDIHEIKIARRKKHNISMLQTGHALVQQVADAMLSVV